jgi:carbonic anhydrase/acetyltransferase-like protein (isoleucine patch superfamily)
MLTDNPITTTSEQFYMNNQNDIVNSGLCRPAGPLNLFAHFIGPNPKTSFNPKSVMPSVDPTSFVGPFSVIIGDVTIGRNVFIAPNVSIRADEGTPFHIGSNTNIQDGVILHGLKDGRVIVNDRKFSIYIGEKVSCTHGCIIHGPCKLGNNVFVGFHAIILNAIIGEGSYISTNALVTGGVRLAPNRFVPAGAIIDTQAKADGLGPVPENDKEFALEVQHVNQEFPSAYSLMFGSVRCSCGLACDAGSVAPYRE